MCFDGVGSGVMAAVVKSRSINAFETAGGLRNDQADRVIPVHGPWRLNVSSEISGTHAVSTRVAGSADAIFNEPSETATAGSTQSAPVGQQLAALEDWCSARPYRMQLQECSTASGQAAAVRKLKASWEKFL